MNCQNAVRLTEAIEEIRRRFVNQQRRLYIEKRRRLENKHPNCISGAAASTALAFSIRTCALQTER
jgi:hypothetical protein